MTASVQQYSYGISILPAQFLPPFIGSGPSRWADPYANTDYPYIVQAFAANSTVLTSALTSTYISTAISDAVSNAAAGTTPTGYYGVLSVFEWDGLSKFVPAFSISMFGATTDIQSVLETATSTWLGTL